MNKSVNADLKLLYNVSCDFKVYFCIFAYLIIKELIGTCYVIRGFVWNSLYFDHVMAALVKEK